MYVIVYQMDKIMSDLNTLLSQAVLPNKLGMKRQLIVEVAKISSKYAHMYIVHMLLLSHSQY